jgi:predicted benzoate:H+ symporter BenE
MFLTYAKDSNLTPGISGAHDRLSLREFVSARPLHAVVRLALIAILQAMIGSLMRDMDSHCRRKQAILLFLALHHKFKQGCE